MCVRARVCVGGEGKGGRESFVQLVVFTSLRIGGRKRRKRR